MFLFNSYVEYFLWIQESKFLIINAVKPHHTNTHYIVNFLSRFHVTIFKTYTVTPRTMINSPMQLLTRWLHDYL